MPEDRRKPAAAACIAEIAADSAMTWPSLYKVKYDRSRIAFGPVVNAASQTCLAGEASKGANPKSAAPAATAASAASAAPDVKEGEFVATITPWYSQSSQGERVKMERATLRGTAQSQGSGARFIMTMCDTREAIITIIVRGGGPGGMLSSPWYSALKGRAYSLTLKEAVASGIVTTGETPMGTIEATFVTPQLDGVPAETFKLVATFRAAKPNPQQPQNCAVKKN